MPFLICAVLWTAAVPKGFAATIGNGRLRLGDCADVENGVSGVEPATPFFCVNGQSELADAVSSTAGKHAVSYAGADLDFSAFLSPHLAIFAGGKAQQIIPHSKEQAVRKSTRHGFAQLQVGRPVRGRPYFTVGQIAVPFGLNFEPGMMLQSELLRELRGMDFWPEPAPGLAIGMLAGEVWGFDVAGTTEQNPTKRTTDGEVVARGTYDFPALRGSRLSASFGATRDNTRRWSFGFINRPYGKALSQVDTLAFEAVRGYVLGSPEWPDQIIRISSKSKYIAKARWIISVEHTRFRYTVGDIGYDTQFKQFALLRASISYLKSDSSTFKSRWMFALGFDGVLE